MLTLLISGAMGRMGRLTAAQAQEDGCSVLAGVDARTEGAAPFPVYPAFSLIPDGCRPDVLVDFSRAELLPDVLSFALKGSIPLVLAATGYGAVEAAAVHDAAAQLPVFRSANLSLGVQVMRFLCAQAARALPGFDIEIVERHHRQKNDAPSGTAALLYDAVASPDSEPVYGRHGRTVRRDRREIGVFSLRGGTVAGQHEAGFYGQGETLQIVHTAESPALFAAGALRAARFIIRQPPGLYGMDDLLAP